MLMKAFCVPCLASRTRWSARAAESGVCTQLFPADSACHQHPAPCNIMIRAQVTHGDTTSILHIQPCMLMPSTPPCKARYSEWVGITVYKGVLQTRKNANKQTRKDDLLWQTVMDRPRHNLCSFSTLFNLEIGGISVELIETW